MSIIALDIGGTCAKLVYLSHAEREDSSFKINDE